MKNTILTIFIAITGILAYSQVQQSNETFEFGSGTENTPVANSADQVVEISGRLIKERIFFKLLMKNEDHESVYSLVREYQDGTIESVDYKLGVANEIGTPLMYCFTESTLPVLDCEYILYRIDEKTTVLGTWIYSATDKTITSGTNETLVVNQ